MDGQLQDDEKDQEVREVEESKFSSVATYEKKDKKKFFLFYCFSEASPWTLSDAKTLLASAIDPPRGVSLGPLGTIAELVIDEVRVVELVPVVVNSPPTYVLIFWSSEFKFGIFLKAWRFDDERVGVDNKEVEVDKGMVEPIN